MSGSRRLLIVLLAALASADVEAKRHKYKGYTIHVVFSNHLDVGFTDLDSNVINLYFHEHYPRAIRLAQDLAVSPDNPDGDVFRYTTHPWLLSLFFDCPTHMGLKCPNNTQLSAVRSAIKDGLVTWHAAPFNPQYEVFKSWLLGAALDLGHDLDDEYELPHKQMISLRDVPGLTRAAIPIFNAKGIKALSAGVNGFSAPPGVPHMTPFVWRDEESDSEIIAMWHPGGYSGTTYGLQIDSRRDCIRTPGLKHVLCVSWRNDNNGPPDSLEELLTMFRVLREQWPGATITTTSMDEYLKHLIQAVEDKHVKLPVVTSEIGDTWVHGIASDPGKMADYRAVLRAVEDCHTLPREQCDMGDKEFKNFTRLLVKVAEHTWGISFNPYFADATNYTNAWLHNLLVEGEAKHPNLAVSLESWRRQRQYIDWALEALPNDHYIREFVMKDRAIRKYSTGVSSESVAAGGGVPVQLQRQQQQQRSGYGSSSSSSTSRGHSAAAAAAVAAAGPVCRENHDELLFCSKHWLIQIDRRTGGLLRLQRLYADDTHSHSSSALGNDWAAAAAAAGDPIVHDLGSATDTDQDTAAAGSTTVYRKQRKLLHQQKPCHTPAAAATPQQQQQQQGGNSHRHHSVPAFGELQYNVYSLDDYAFVWDHYAYLHPVWVGDFGKWNMSATVNMSRQAKPELSELYHRSDDEGVEIHMRMEFPNKLVKEAGAPEAAWVILHSPLNSAALHLTLVWQNKTATRLPEALWLRFKPGRGAVHESSWRMNKIDSQIDPVDVIANGSHSIHAVNQGISVRSKDSSEQLSIRTLDVPLVNAGRPNPFYNPTEGPDMSEGMSFNIVNNIWGTNYIMWMPYTPEDEPGMAFRFVIESERLESADVTVV